MTENGKKQKKTIRRELTGRETEESDKEEWKRGETEEKL
jgi:hypothetical protein